MSQPNWEITDSVRANPILAHTMEAMRRIAPLELADTSFDNVGILLQAPSPISESSSSQSHKHGIMLAIDLTTDVCQEILSSPNNIKLAIIYHPIIFRGLKSLTFADPQQTSLLRLAAAGVSVFCPHTSLDATPGGINDWLGKVVSSKHAFTELESDDALSSFRQKIYPYLSTTKNTLKGFERAGMGRLIELDAPETFEEIVRRVKQNLNLTHVQACKATDNQIKTVAVCAGSGSSVFSGVKADLYLTGELSHHEILAYKAAGACVIVTNHTNTERKYLRDVLQHWLRSELPEQYSISVSKTDRDPLTVF
ncbi:related to Ngg1p-interacting factor 3 [Melanopsichium pennsylvanicum]|uniref:Related to Ngg1p-interacting factor 3 n=2 Tax=Melanopsichium pennsylvanicum TaxID=63383 RepID=A0AAJ4XHC1_9BASI|nr:related to Ngg1p-interacting factor 3 [Melanopsichium pennsylvanicum 4]SNX82158.1 related to Ngg1p-interacting factor 3 [Melanopsichium pennsylvanicum]